jgi:hypothetical protein
VVVLADKTTEIPAGIVVARLHFTLQNPKGIHPGHSMVTTLLGHDSDDTDANVCDEEGKIPSQYVRQTRDCKNIVFVVLRYRRLK